MKRLIYISILSIFFISCKREVYHEFTNEEKAFLVYNDYEVFKLKNEVTNQIFDLTVVQRYIRFKKDSPSGVGINRKTHYEHEGRIEFEGDDPDNSGYIYIYKDKIDQFVSNITFRLENKGYGDGRGEYEIVNIQANGISYKNVRKYIADNNSIMYYSLDYGIVKLENLDNGVTHVRVP